MGSSNRKPVPSSEAVAPVRHGIQSTNICVCKKLSECFENGLFADVVLITKDGKRISTHRMILYTASDYFKAMLMSGLKECGQLEIPIKGVTGDILLQLVEYCYGGEIAIDIDNVEEIIKAATMLQFTGVQEKCTDFLSTILSELNCLGIQHFANLHNVARLKGIANAFVLDHFMEVSTQDQFYQLSVDHLVALLKDDNLNVAREVDVFNALIDWVNHDPESRKQSLDILLGCVRFQHIKDSCILNEVSPKCIQMNLPEHFSSIVARRSFTNRTEKPRSKLQFVLVNDRPARIEVDRYYPLQNIWARIKTTDLKIDSFAVIHRAGKLIFIGGIDAQQKPINTMKSIDLKSDEIVDLPPFMSSRSSPSAELINDSIYVFGGWGEQDGIVRTMERFDFSMNTWTEVTPMPTPRFLSAHVVFSGHLFVIGGRNIRDRFVDCVEFYDISTNMWQTVASMRHQRSGSAACASNGFIYVLGGENEDDVLGSIERYDPRENSWTELEFALPVPRRFFSPGIGDGDWIYLAGGADDDDNGLNTFEKVNVVTGEGGQFKELQTPFYCCYLIKC